MPLEYDEHDADTLARTIYGEARNQLTIGQAAVAWVVRNRATRRGYAGTHTGKKGDVALVCQQPWQFSCWNKGDPNLPKLLRVDLTLEGAHQLAVARSVLDGDVDDPTHGADLYYVTDMPDPPEWASTRKVVAVIGAHTFLDSRIVVQ